MIVQIEPGYRPPWYRTPAQLEADAVRREWVWDHVNDPDDEEDDEIES